MAGDNWAVDYSYGFAVSHTIFVYKSDCILSTIKQRSGIFLFWMTSSFSLL